MTLSAHQQTIVSATAASHLVLLATATDLFHWFESAVSGNKALDNIDTKLLESSAVINDNIPSGSSLSNEFSAFAKSLKTAYSDFGRDIVHRMGVDDCSQVRNLARNIAAGAYTQLSKRAREHLIRSIEGAPVEPLAAAA